MNEQQAFQIRIELVGSDPLVWRTLLIAEDATLDDLHACIQIAFGWYDIHMYQFNCLETRESYVCDPDEWETLQGEDMPFDTMDTQLKDCLYVNEEWEYIYDFGDYWQHKIIIEKELTVNEQETLPKLLAWQENNMAEDAGGVDGYYEKMKILNDPDHEEYEFMKHWMEIQHQDFDEAIVQESLLELNDPYEDDPIREFADILDELFLLCDEQALIRLKRGTRSCVVLLTDCDYGKNVQIFHNEKDFTDSYMCSFHHDNIHPLYQNGYVFRYPKEKNDIPAKVLEDFMRPQLTYYEAGKGDRDLSEQEFSDFRATVYFLELMSDLLADAFSTLPDVKNGFAIEIEETDNGVKLSLVDYEAKLRKSKVKMTKYEQERITKAKASKECLHINLLAIPDLLHERNDVTYFIAANGDKTGFLHELHGNTKDKIMSEVKKFLLSYMEIYGVPKAIYVDDAHLLKLFQEICKERTVELIWQDVDPLIFNEQYDEALMELNSFDDVDRELLAKLSQFSEKELIEYIERQPETMLRKILKQFLFVSLFYKGD